MSDFRQYAGVDFSAEFLVHYGVGHEKGGHSGRYKWGSGDRPYQRTSMEGNTSRKEARQYQKKLNRMDKQQVKYIASNRKALDDVAKYTHNSMRAINKYGQFSSKARKQGEKLVKSIAAAKVTAEQLRESEAETWKTIAELNEKGYDLSSTKVLRDSAGAKAMIAQVLGGVIGQAIYRSKTGTVDFVEGNKFAVTEKRGDSPTISFDNRDLNSLLSKSKSNVQNLKDAQREAISAYFEAEERLKKLDKKDPKYEAVSREVAEKEKAATESMIALDRAKYPKDSDEKLAKRTGLPIEEIRSVTKAENNRIGEGQAEEYDQARGKALDAYEQVKSGKTPAQQSMERHKQFVNEQQKYKLTDAQQEHYNDAKTKDRWDMTFLEMYQPDTWNAAKALREYKAYLLDPEEWIKDH